MLKLRVLSGDMKGLEFPLDAPEVVIGRRKDSRICLPLDLRISRVHARIYHQDDALLLEDMGSANGTFMGRRRIYSPSVLHAGDQFRVGRTWLELVEEAHNGAAQEVAEQVQIVDSDSEAAIDAAEVTRDRDVVFAVSAIDPAVHRVPDDAEAQQRLAVILDLGRALGTTLELPVLLQVVVNRISELLPVEQAALLLVDTETGQITPHATLFRDRAATDNKLAISRDMVTRALRERLAVLTTDATSDSRFKGSDSVRDLKIRSAIVAPMVAGGESVGIIHLATSSSTYIFSEQDVHLVVGIAAQAAVAIEKARLYTDLRRAYDELKAAQEHMLASERTATVGLLSASIAHDMANIVSPIRLFVKMLLEGRPLARDAQEALQCQIERLTTLTERLLAFSRGRCPDLQPTDLNVSVHNALELVGTELTHRHVTLNLQLAPDLPPVNADTAQIERALLNLLLNAAEALEDCDPKTVTVSTEAEDGEVVIAVSDTGPGIPEEVQKRLLEPFFTTKETGTGLGLFSCHRIVEEEHGGSLEIDSRPGAGTTIRLRLPALAAGGQEEG